MNGHYNEAETRAVLRVGVLLFNANEQQDDEHNGQN